MRPFSVTHLSVTHLSVTPLTVTPLTVNPLIGIYWPIEYVNSRPYMRGAVVPAE